jgi:hypothetical protein
MTLQRRNSAIEGGYVPKLNVPDRQRTAIRALLDMEQPLFSELLTLLRGGTASIELLSELPSSIKISNLSSIEAERIGSAISSLYLVRASRDVSIDAFIDDVVEAVASFEPKAELPESRQRFKNILDIEPLTISAKAYLVISNHQRTLHGLKILSDVRFAFQSDPEAEPYGAVIVHTMRVSYHEDDNHKEFYVALDDNDLVDLRKALDRAEAKSRLLLRKLELTGVPYLGTRRDKKVGGTR